MIPDRLIVLVGLIIGAIVGVGVGSMVGEVEFFGMIGAVIGAAFGIVGVIRRDKKRIDTKTHRPRQNPAQGRRSRKRSR